MKIIKDTLQDAVATGIDAMDKTRTPKSRSADAIQRSAMMLEADVPASVVAFLMQVNTGEPFSEQDVNAYEKLYKASHSKVAITKKQTVSLVRNQQGQEDGSFPNGHLEA